MSKLTVACIGAGYFSQFHIDGWRRIERTTLVGVADQDLGRAQATGAAAFDDVSAMLAALTPDIVDIILPPAGHADAIRAALAVAPRAIICQKPFCHDLDEAREMATLAEDAGIPLIVHENFRFQPWNRVIRKALDDGEIGVPMQAVFRLRPGDGQGPQAYLDRQPYFQTMRRFLVHETGVHWVDTFRYLFGNPSHVYADLRRVNPVISGEDAGVILFDHPECVRSMLDANRSLDHAADNTRRTMGEALIEGTGGALSVRGDGSVMLRKFGARDEICLLGPDESPNFGGDCTRILQAHVVDAVLDGAPFENLATDYLKVIEIENAIYRAAEAGCKQVI